MAINRSNVVVSLLMGVVGAMIAPAIAPVLRRAARPVAKSAIRGSYVLYEKGRVAAAEMGEKVEDLIAEARAEMPPPADSMTARSPEAAAAESQA
jgi:hypothetical protein